MKEIVILDSKLVGRRLISRVNVQGSIRKYFRSLNFFVEYDVDITADRSILNIPMLTTILPLAWLTGSDIYVDELDKTFKDSMDELKHVFMKVHPDAPFTTSIKADNLVKNEIGEVDPSERTGLLFSGGVDSVYSLFTNMDSKPRLIMIWGVEGHPYPKYQDYWDKVISIYSEFARKMGVRFHLVKTDVLELLDFRRIEHDFHEALLDGTFWARLQHSLVLIPLIAPLSIDRFDRLLIAATNDPSHSYLKHPWGSRPSTDEKIVWADLKVKHDGYIPRPEKIMGPISDYLKKGMVSLRVCLKRRREHEKLNCSACEKCFRTIVPLFLAGLDPNSYGFEVDEFTFQSMRTMFEKGKLDNEAIEAYWKPIQGVLPEKITQSLYNSEEFFEWFKSYDLKSKEKDVWFYRNLYNNLPYLVSKVLDVLYRKAGIRIHDHSPIRHSKEVLQISKKHENLTGE